jgi:phage terminase large subunit-like protein
MDFRHIRELLDACQGVYSELKNPMRLGQNQRRHGIAIAASLGPATYAAQYQQAPVGSSELLSPDWFRIHDQPSHRNAGDRIIQSWDIPATASEFEDYSVYTTWRVATGGCDLLDLYREKLGYPALKRAILAQAQRFAPNTVLVNDGKWGRARSRECLRRVRNSA